MRQGRISLLLLVALWSCAPDDPPAPPPPPPAARPPEPPLPALGEVRFREWSEVDDEKFLELPAPAAPGELRWNFALGNRFGYSFTESLSQRMEREAGGRKALNTGREKNTGVFEFVAGRDQTALAGSKIQTAEASMNDQPISRESMANKPASVSECIVTEDGGVESRRKEGLADSRMYFQSLFALQPGKRDLSPGTITTRIAGYNKVGRYECVRLESEFEILTEKPSERLLLRGRVIGYFAIAERRFIRSSAAVATSSRGNALSNGGLWLTSSLDAVTRFRVRYIE